MQVKRTILLSGGIDSCSLTYLYREELSLAITIDYGQRAAISEISSSKKICEVLGIKHEVIQLKAKNLGSGEMAYTNSRSSLAAQPEWWPFRNQLIITLAAMRMIAFGSSNLLVGSVKNDKKFLDGTSRFFRALNKCLNVQEGSIQIETPAIKMTTRELIVESNVPDLLLLWTHSCHISNVPCGRCNGCAKYFKVLKSVGIN